MPRSSTTIATVRLISCGRGVGGGGAGEAGDYASGGLVAGDLTEKKAKFVICW